MTTAERSTLLTLRMQLQETLMQVAVVAAWLACLGYCRVTRGNGETHRKQSSLATTYKVQLQRSDTWLFHCRESDTDVWV